MKREGLHSAQDCSLFFLLRQVHSTLASGMTNSAHLVTLWKATKQEQQLYEENS